MGAVGDRPRPLLGSLLFVVVVPGTVAVLIPALITRWDVAAWGPWPLIVALSVGLIAAGAVVLLHAVWRFAVEGRGTPSPTAPTERLVVSGFYRHTRNPMYVAVAAVIGGQALLCPSIGIALYLTLFGVAVTAFVHWYEEPTLRAAHGESYLTYQQEVPRWVPRLRPWPDPTRPPT
jgi:protein-S-isoprenylcysteine O-methyltransferase Ste14